MKKNRKNPFRGSSGDRPLAARILAIIVVIFLAISMVITFLPSFVFSAEEEWGAGTRRNGDSWTEAKKESGLSLKSVAGAVIEIPAKSSGERPPLVVDAADLLTDSEEAELVAGLESFRKDQDFDIVVLTVYSLDGYDVVDYADIFYDQNGYGGGEEYDGVLILISTEYRDWTMITSGYGITAITDYSLDQIEDEILPDLSGGRYLDAFKKYADHCANCVLEARDGNIIDEWIEDPPESSESVPGSATQSQGRGDYPVAMNVGTAGIIGIIVSWFRNGRKKSEMKTVHRKTQARDYIRRDSLTLTENRDRFLYKSINRIPLPRDDDDNHHSKPGHFGGSTIHTSAGGGGFHGGGRPGKF